jgi:hypothetical protein
VVAPERNNKAASPTAILLFFRRHAFIENPKWSANEERRALKSAPFRLQTKKFC